MNIGKAFHQISIIPEHRSYLRFLWVHDIFKISPSIVRLRLSGIVLVVTSLLILLNGTVRNHVLSYHFDHEYVMQVLLSFFIDDFSGESKTTIAVFELYKKLKIRFLEGQFNLTKRRTNDEQLHVLMSQVLGTKIPVARRKVLGLFRINYLHKKCSLVK